MPEPGREMRSYQGRTAARPFCLFQGPASPSKALARALASVSRAPQALPGPWGPPARPGPCGGGLALGMTEFAYPLVSRSGLESPAGLREKAP